MVEEEDKWQADEDKREDAALKIQGEWRKHQVRIIKDINYQVATALIKSFGKIEAVHMTGVKKCFICKKQNAIRQCGPDVSITKVINDLVQHGPLL